jgi:hypothetical protein
MPSNNGLSYRDPEVPSGTQLTAVQRAEILTLFHCVGWSKARIARELHLARTTVILTIQRSAFLDNLLISKY